MFSGHPQVLIILTAEFPVVILISRLNSIKFNMEFNFEHETALKFEFWIALKIELKL